MDQFKKTQTEAYTEKQIENTYRATDPSNIRSRKTIFSHNGVKLLKIKDKENFEKQLDEKSVT